MNSPFNQKTQQVRYLRRNRFCVLDKGNRLLLDRTPQSMLLTEKTGEGRGVYYALVVCNEKFDTFNKKKGMMIAQERIKKAKQLSVPTSPTGSRSPLYGWFQEDDPEFLSLISIFERNSKLSPLAYTVLKEQHKEQQKKNKESSNGQSNNEQGISGT